MFENWAMPVVNKRWGVAAVVLDWMKRRSGYRWFVRPAHRAWERAVDA